MREHADFCIGEYEAADQIVFEIIFERAAERFFGQTAPRFARQFVGVEPALHFFL